MSEPFYPVEFVAFPVFHQMGVKVETRLERHELPQPATGPPGVDPLVVSETAVFPLDWWQRPLNERVGWLNDVVGQLQARVHRAVRYHRGEMSPDELANLQKNTR